MQRDSLQAWEPLRGRSDAGRSDAGRSARHLSLSGLIGGRREASGLKSRNTLNALGAWKSVTPGVTRALSTV